MARAQKRTPSLEIRPLTPDRWGDLEALFGPRGANGGCWCMWWRLSQAEYRTGAGERNRRAFRRIVKHGPPPGLLAYIGGEAAGWCAIASRDDYPRLDRSRNLARVDGTPVWSLPCFFIARRHRGAGVSRALIQAALAYARERGREDRRSVSGRHGGRSQRRRFDLHRRAIHVKRAGFRVAARRSPRRPIMRKALR